MRENLKKALVAAAAEKTRRQQAVDRDVKVSPQSRIEQPVSGGSQITETMLRRTHFSLTIAVKC